jgi:Holliday junction resolvase RusA-like endonuclease
MTGTAPWVGGNWRPGPHDQPAVTLIVWGRPGVAGNKKAFPIYRGSGPERHFTGRVVVTEAKGSERTKNWRTAVREAGQTYVAAADGIHLRPGFPLDEALVMDMVLTVPKPTGAPKGRRTWPITRPDVLKMCRAVEDELTSAAVIRDDSLIVDYGRLSKVYPGEDVDALDAPGCVIRIWRKADIHGARISAARYAAAADAVARASVPPPLF